MIVPAQRELTVFRKPLRRVVGKFYDDLRYAEAQENLAICEERREAVTPAKRLSKPIHVQILAVLGSLS